MSKSGHFLCEKEILLIITPVQYGQTMIVSGKPRPMEKIRKCSDYHENPENLNPLYSSSAFKEVSNPPGSRVTIRLHSTEPPGEQPELGFKQVPTLSLSLSPTAILNQFYRLQRSFEEKRRHL